MKVRKFLNSRIRRVMLTAGAVVFGATACSADVINLYTDETVADIDAGTTIWTSNVDTGDPANGYAILDVPGLGVGTSPFGTGNALQFVDFTDLDKPEMQGELAAPLLEPFRIDFQSYNLSNAESTQAIRFRMGNSGANLTSEKRAAFSVSWQADGDVGGKYSGDSDGSSTDVDTKNSDPLDADPLNPSVHDITMIANGNTTGMWAYSAFGETRNLNPLSFDLYIDGVLLNDEDDPADAKYAEFINGMEFHFEKGDSEYDPSLGIQRFGLFSGSTSNNVMNVLFDNIVITTTAADMGVTVVPEPSSCVLVMTALAGLIARRRV